MKGLEQRKIQPRIETKVNRVHVLVDWSHEGQKRSTSSALRFSLIWWLSTQGGLNSAKQLKKVLQVNLCHWDRTGSLYKWFLSLLLLLLLPNNSPLFLHSFVPLRLLIIETCSRASIMVRLRSQNGLSWKWLLLCQENHACFSSSRAGPGVGVPYLLTKWIEPD